MPNEVDEVTLAGALLSGVTEVADIIGCDMLDGEVVRNIFRAYRQTHRQGEKPNIGKLLTGKTEGNFNAHILGSFKNGFASSPADAIALAQSISAAYYGSIVFARLEKEINSVRNGECDFLDAANEIEGHIKRFRQNTVGGDSGHSIAEILDAQGDRIFESRRGLSTGLSSIDKYIGGLCPGDLVVIGARPKKGKTSIMVTITALANVPTVFFSLEMTALEIVRKLICITGRIPGRELFNRRTEADTIKAELWKRPLRIIDTPGLNAVDIAARSYSIPNLKLVVVDYAQILGRLPGAKDSRESLVESVKGLKVLAKRLNCAVIIGSQLNRESEGKVTPAGLAESDELLRSADCVLLLDWKFEDAPPETPFVQTPVEVEVQAVCRHGCGGKFPLLFYRGQGRFGEVVP
ncbi:MAG: hypothetical protein LBU64_13075 [Planctomycetota bacterium]|jgi:replicative DNA helicase|nr:hypothetical protein [Planctomycetota bacterium]